MPSYNQGVFTPKNPTKYVGTYPIIFRSAWELTFMNTCDNHPNIQQWSSESIKIPYQHPLTGRWHQYIPDFFVIFVDKNGRKRGEILEIKPASQNPRNPVAVQKAKTRKAQEILLVNQAKWIAAEAWCKKQGIVFRIMTQEQLYRQAGSK
jgi:hypothetical protein